MDKESSIYERIRELDSNLIAVVPLILNQLLLNRGVI